MAAKNIALRLVAWIESKTDYFHLFHGKIYSGCRNIVPVFLYRQLQERDLFCALMYCYLKVSELVVSVIHFRLKKNKTHFHVGVKVCM